MDSIDKLLSQIQSDEQKPAKMPKQQPAVAPLQSSSNLDSLLENIKADFLKQPATSKSLKNNPPIIDSILLQVKTDYDEQDRARSQLKQQQLQAEQLKQIETLKVQAKSWLEKLDPLSTEGLWFEQFAQRYPTKLEAAINYLQES